MSEKKWMVSGIPIGGSVGDERWIQCITDITDEQAAFRHTNASRRRWGRECS